MVSEIEKKKNTYRRCFSTDFGKDVLDDLRKQYGRKTSHVPGDSHTTAYNEGCRRALLRIENMIEGQDE